MYWLGKNVLQALLGEAKLDVLYWSIGHSDTNHIVEVLFEICRGVGDVNNMDGINLIYAVQWNVREAVEFRIVAN